MEEIFLRIDSGYKASIYEQKSFLLSDYSLISITDLIPMEEIFLRIDSGYKASIYEQKSFLLSDYSLLFRSLIKFLLRRYF